MAIDTFRERSIKTNWHEELNYNSKDQSQLLTTAVRHQKTESA